MWEVTNNTSSLNAGSGFESACTAIVASDGRYELARNIGYGNGAYGVRWTKPDVSVARCNDWFGNVLGAVQGKPPSDEDLALDPLFCDATGGDFHLAANSPLLDGPACGLVGALGVGCPAASGNALRLSVLGPSPSPGPVRIEFELRDQAAIELDVFDVQGRLVASPARGVWPAGRHAVEWNGRGAAAGVYLVRCRYASGEIVRRFVRTP
jgi:hypothetical protein